MVRIVISPEAFDAIARTMLLGSVGTENGERLICLESRVVDRLRSLRAPGRVIPT